MSSSSDRHDFPDRGRSINIDNKPLPGDQSRQLFSDNVFRNLHHATRFAIDIGGSLAKVVYISKVKRRQPHYSFSEDEAGTGNKSAAPGHGQGQGPGDIKHSSFRLHFIKAETRYIGQCLEFLKKELVHCNGNVMKDKVVKATGGGALKYKDLIMSELGCKLDTEGEMDCIVKGCDFLIKNIRNEVFEFNKVNKTNPYGFHNYENVGYPYLIVNIGSGVSILKVESDLQYTRIGGTAMGGGTFWGIGSMLTGAQGFDQLLKLATQGHTHNVDMWVKDIYGGDCGTLGLPGDLTASHFGKTVRGSKDGPIDKSAFSDADMAKSLLHMISNGIGQIACLYARVHNVQKIYFGGFFIRNNRVTMHTISYAVDFFSEGSVKALFLRHEGYLGAIGAFLKGTEEDDFEKYSWDENYMFDTSFDSPNDEPNKNGSVVTMFELDATKEINVPFPLLLHPEKYVADTQDLVVDKAAREFWLDIFKKETVRTREIALEFEPDTFEKADLYQKLFENALEKIKQQPLAQGQCSVRGLLNLNQKSLRDAGYHDIYLNKKQSENDAAKKQFQERLDFIKTVPNETKLLELIYGVLSGNFFDWGSKLSSAYFKPGFGFNDARELIQPRPWLIDHFDAFQKKLSSSAKYKCALIFVDNSGFDLFLGILPMALYFIEQGTKVILACNSFPALNDVTYEELKYEMGQLAASNNVVDESLKSGMLLLAETGSYSPCLDLSTINRELTDLVVNEGTDLVLLTGMGRAIHTNLNARFKCDVLKLAVIKNQQLGAQMGGDHKFCVVCKFEASPHP